MRLEYPFNKSSPCHLSPFLSAALPTHHSLSLIQDGDTAACLKRVPLHLSGYVLMKWAISPLQTHTHGICDIPDSSALTAFQANSTCQWNRLFSSHSQVKGQQLNPIGAYSYAGTWAPGGPGGPDV